jgi:hypothetical protein
LANDAVGVFDGGTIHDAHPAFAQLLQELIATELLA